MSLSWDSLCRLCANINNCNAFLFSGDGEKKGILLFIEKFLSITIDPQDSLPTKVCQGCLDKVIELQNYAVQCDKVQLFFKKYNASTIILNDHNQFESLKSEFMYTDEPIIVKRELQEVDDSHDYVDDDLDSLPLSNLIDIEDQKVLPQLNFNPSKKKPGRGRPRKKKITDEENLDVDDKKTVVLDFNELINDYDEIKDVLDKKIVVSKSKSQKKEKNATKNSNLEKKIRQSTKTMLKGHFNIFKFNCHICEKELSNWHALKLHVRKSHKCNAKVLCICLKYLSTHKSLLHHIARHNPDEGFKCKMCDKAYGYKKDLDNHLLQHIPRDELPFVCCICAKRFTTARILKVHEKTHRPREERYIWPCDTCDNKFATKGALTNHKRVIHDKIKPFVCDLCGHACSTKANMDEHRTRHTDVKNFECNECQKCFKTKGALVRHMDTHGDTAYQCPHCPMLLNSRRTLRNHLFVHDDTASHVCHFCGKAFKRRKECKSHLKLHTGERPYTCPWCPRSFTNGSNCRIHKRRMHPQEFAVAEATNPFAPSTVVKPEPKKIIHALFKRNPAISTPSNTNKTVETINNTSQNVTTSIEGNV